MVLHPSGEAGQRPPRALSVLLRGARQVLARRVRAALDDAGYGDLAPNGPFVVSAMAHGKVPMSELVAALGASKQAASQLVDNLVLRGYLQRTVDPEDRRRVVLHLTERGFGAAAVVRRAAGELEATIEKVVGSDRLETARLVLETVIATGGSSD